MVLEGSVTIESNDIWGNRTILSYVGKGQFFAETYALLKNEPLLVDVTANEDCEILFLRVDKMEQLNLGTQISSEPADYFSAQEPDAVRAQLSYCAEERQRAGHGISEFSLPSEA